MATEYILTEPEVAYVREHTPEETPSKRIMRYGPAALSDSEILAIVIAEKEADHGDHDKARLMLARSNGNLAKLMKPSAIIPTDAIDQKLYAAFELSRRIHSQSPERRLMRTPAQAAAIFMPFFKGEEKERLLLLCLDTKCQFNPGTEIVLSEGSINASIIDAREIYKAALMRNAASIIMMHNHPSGDPAPSREDIEVTRRVSQVGKLLQVPVHDHIIIGDGTYASLRELGYL